MVKVRNDFPESWIWESFQNIRFVDRFYNIENDLLGIDFSFYSGDGSIHKICFDFSSRFISKPFSTPQETQMGLNEFIIIYPILSGTEL